MTSKGRARPGTGDHPAAARILCAALAVATSATAQPVAAAGEQDIFVEQAAALGLDFRHLNGMSGAHYFCEMMGAGGAFLDYDNDGDLDVYLVQGGPLDGAGRKSSPGLARAPSDRLYRNDLRDGRPRFVDVTESSGIKASGYGMGVATGDYDNDGWTDLYVTNFGANQLLRNRGDGTFSDVTAAAGAGDPAWSVSATFLDFDRDGRLDLFVVNYVDFALANHKTCRSHTGAADYCSPMAYNPQPDRLLHNRGDGTFEVVTAANGLDRAVGPGLGVAAADLNGDGWVDVYVANDQAANHMWINRRGAGFGDEALLAGTALNADGRPEAGMGVALGDIDGDGDEDLVVSHLNRETNTLYSNEGEGFFEDRSVASGLGGPSWEYTGFGIAWLDYDNDGWLDLFVANGAVKRLEHLVARHDPFPLHQPNLLLRNLGGGRFEEVRGGGAALALSEVSRGVAIGDVDNDGDTDILLTNNNGPVRLLLNRVGQDRPWLGLRLVRGEPARPAIGAVATVRAGGGRQQRRVGTGGSYASARDPRLLFGLGAATGGPVEVEIRWPSGKQERRTFSELGRYHTLREPR